MPRRSNPSSQAPAFQLARLAKTPPRGSAWSTEIKWDGFRLAAHVHHDQVKLVSRGGQDYTDRAPGVVAALRAENLTRSVLDGELCALEPSGRTSFGLLQRKLGTFELVYVVFDALALAGSDITALPLRERRAVLAESLRPGPVLRLSESFEHEPAVVLEHACRLNLEGIVCKRLDARYRAGETGDWLKIKCTRSNVFWIIGFAPARGLRNSVGSLLLATRAGAYAGRVGTGISGADSAKLYGLLAPLVVEVRPTVEGVPRGAATRGIRWVSLQALAEVKFTEFTRDGTLRHPVYHAVHTAVPARYRDT
jgi:bifunctional non-homologous end joining protein LigD